MAEDSDVVVVTGASAGIGRVIARAFAEEGARLGLLAWGEEELEGTRRDVEEAGGLAVTVQTDVADADQVEAAADEVEEVDPEAGRQLGNYPQAFGHIGLINSALVLGEAQRGTKTNPDVAGTDATGKNDTSTDHST